MNYARDFVLTIVLPFFLRKKFDFYVGSNPLDAFAGIVLRKLGFAQRVIFYKIDYVPVRFANPILNTLYDRIDRLSSEHCDWTWNLAPSMIDEQAKRRMRLGPQLVVPIGNNFARIQRRPISDVAKNRLVYMGSLRKGQGIQLAVEALVSIRKLLPHCELVIVGTGPLEEELKTQVKKLGLDPHVTFMGEVPNHEEVERILTTCGIALAPYEPSSDNFTQYTEPGKVKVYLACGLPVVITSVPPIARGIEERGAGIVIEYSVRELTAAIQKLVVDDALYSRMRSAAVTFASEYTWDRIFKSAFDEMLVSTSPQSQ